MTFPVLKLVSINHRAVIPYPSYYIALLHFYYIRNLFVVKFITAETQENGRDVTD